MPHTAPWWCADRACGRVLGTVRPDGGLEVDELKRVTVDRHGTMIYVMCPDCGRERPWKARRAA